MGAWAFHGWSMALPDGIHVLPIELPGRNSRMGEQKHTSMSDLVEALADGILPYIKGFKYAIFGHSMGAWVGYELAKRLQELGHPPPVRLYVSANRAPHLAGKDNDVDPVDLHTLSFDEFWDRFEQRYGTVEALRSSSVKGHVWPLLKADFQVVETYQPSNHIPLPCGVIAFGATADVRYTPEQVEAWVDCAAPEHDDSFRLHWIRGGHQYLLDDPSEMLTLLSSDLLETCARREASE